MTLIIGCYGGDEEGTIKGDRFLTTFEMTLIIGCYGGEEEVTINIRLS
jgi:hypothetical protein